MYLTTLGQYSLNCFNVNVVPIFRCTIPKNVSRSSVSPDRRCSRSVADTRGGGGGGGRRGAQAPPPIIFIEALVLKSGSTRKFLFQEVEPLLVI